MKEMYIYLGLDKRQHPKPGLQLIATATILHFRYIEVAKTVKQLATATFPNRLQ